MQESLTNFGSDPAILDAVGRANAVVVLDEFGSVRHWSAGATCLFGWTAADCEGRPWVELGTITNSVRAAEARHLLAEVASGARREIEWIARRADGQTILVHSSVAPLLAADGAVVGVVAVSVDLSRRDGFEAALVRAAPHDRLTTLPGRSLFAHEVDLALADRRGPRAAAVLVLDLDRFGQINDEYGHAAGDEVLVATAERLRSAVRGGDVVARLGADEFGVFVHLGGTFDDAVDVADRIARAVAEPLRVSAGILELGASIGVAIVGPDDDAEGLLARADAALHRARHADPLDRALLSS